MQLFDSHTHLNDPAFSDQVPAAIEHARQLGVVNMAIVGSNPVMNRQAIELAQQYPALVAIVGFHPEDAALYSSATVAKLEQQLQMPQVVALGEIGMDFHQQATGKKLQERVFREQIELAQAYHLPISIHNRDAVETTYRILREAHVENLCGIMHSFNGDVGWMQKFLDLGLYLSYSGVVSFKKTKEIHEAARQTPLNRLLVETDAPYLAPEPLRGQQNEPANTLYTLEAVARFRDVDPDVIAQATYANARRVFGLEGDHETN
ncbi:TatD family hydrolase [Fructilactobacillus florum]|uniref:Deoxyribonuclease YabD n=1 Tax=Fructilactobacillus florum DSM 22689 = JCM 16035 TaxID=1423745 RepID=A0A0R2CE47_9LACO|nr:TatD family hydrolase [Fructilactobacillus florum]KRM90046.1 deoxyribonuclease YabD [Fructilactobacillus florum DSM 22689 = JCM 16035]